MQFMPWSQELEIGIGEIDDQHQWLVSLTNQLHTHLSHGEPDQTLIGDCLAQLLDYTMNHFIAEEELLRRLGYPETDAHVQQHNMFCQQVMELLDRHDSGDQVGCAALDLLKNWLINHITRADKAYVDYFRQQKLDVNI